MKFVADENVDLPIIARLRNDGHEVHAVVEMSAGIPDEEVLKQANQQGVVLLTGDKDFGELENAFTVISHHNLRIRPRL